MDFRRLHTQYSNELSERLIPFWLNFSQGVSGGYYNVLASNGEVVSTDKWLTCQAQQVIAFDSLLKLYPNNEPIKNYLKHGIDYLKPFLESKKIPEIVDCTGRIVKNTTDFEVESLVIAALANTEKFDKHTILKLLKKREKAHSQAIQDIQSERQHKNISELTAFGRALMACKSILPKKVFVEKANGLILELMNHFFEPRAAIILENVYIGGGYCESLEGRRFNPGKIFEAALVFIELSESTNNKKLINELQKQILYIAETTWDEKYGGFYNTVDLKSLPQANFDANFKSLSTHTAALSALLKVYSMTKKTETFKLWQKVHDYTWLNFSDRSKEGEWIPILDRHSEPITNLKATPTHTAFHTVFRFVENISFLEALA